MMRKKTLKTSKDLADYFSPKSVRWKILKRLAEEGPRTTFDLGRITSKSSFGESSEKSSKIAAYSSVHAVFKKEIQPRGLVRVEPGKNEKGHPKDEYSLTGAGVIAAIAHVGPQLDMDKMIKSCGEVMDLEPDELELLRIFWEVLPSEVISACQGVVLFSPGIRAAGGDPPTKLSDVIQKREIIESFAEVWHSRMGPDRRRELRANKIFIDAVKRKRDQKLEEAKAIERLWLS